MIGGHEIPERPIGWGRATAAASGDFACNLYWQSATLFLLFFYTDVLEIAPAVAGAIYLAGLVWDGVAGLLIGLAADRLSRGGGARDWVRLGALPLGLAFLLVYWAPPARGLPLILIVVAAHLAFRTLYAAVNVPYVALLAEVARTSGDRSRVAGLRMIFGAGAAVLVSVLTVRVTGTSARGAAGGFLLVAAVFAAVGSLVLLWISNSGMRRGAGDTPEVPRDRQPVAVRLRLNRAFLSLNLAMIAAVVGTTMVGKSVLYYYKYQLHDATAAGSALAMMGVVGVLFVPVWMAAAVRWGVRRQWFASIATAAAALTFFAAHDPRTPLGMGLFLALFQAAVSGFSFGFWAMLPDAIEYRSSRTADRQALMFGLAALLQKVGVGVAAALVGLVLTLSGYRANVAQSESTLLSLRAAMILVPLVALAASAAAMAFNPLRPRVE